METGEEVAGSKEEHDLSRADERSDVTSKDVTIVDCKETGVHSFTAGDAATHCEAKGRKKLNCVLCEKSFTATLDLDIHVRAHPEVVQFVLELADAEPRNDEGVAETVLEEVAVPFATQNFLESGDSLVCVEFAVGSDAVQFYPSPENKSVSNDRSLQTTPATKGKSKRRKRGRPPHGLCPKIKEETVADPLCYAQEDLQKSVRDDHDENKHSRTSLTCNLCEETFTSIVRLQRHSSVVHKAKPFSCSKCSKRFASGQKQRAHEAACGRPKPEPQYLQAPEKRPCEYCGKEFLRLETLKAHIAVQHTAGGKTRFRCGRCGRRFSQKGALKVHQNNPRACQRDFEMNHSLGTNLTEELLPDETNLAEEVNNVTEEVTTETSKPHKCDECGKSLATLGGLEVHKRKHTGIYPFKCEECGKGFNNSALLEGHLNHHKGFRPHTCSKCNKGFFHKSNLHRHFRFCDPATLAEKRKQRTREESHICAFCGKIMQTAGGLLLHMNKHTGKFPFNCEFCSKGFNSNMLLKAHLDSHNGVKGFICEFCGKRYGHKSNLNRHVAYCESREQPSGGTPVYPCDLCDKTYKRKESLAEHKKTKHSVQKFACTLCGKEYDSRGSLFWHTTKSRCAKGMGGEPTPRRRKPKAGGTVARLMPDQTQTQQHQPGSIALPNTEQHTLTTLFNVFDSTQPEQQQLVFLAESSAIPLDTAVPTSTMQELETINASQSLMDL